MEAYSSSVDMLPVVVGGVVGRILRPGDGQLVVDYVGFLRWIDEHRSAGRCIATWHSSHPSSSVGDYVSGGSARHARAQVDEPASTSAHTTKAPAAGGAKRRWEPAGLVRRVGRRLPAVCRRGGAPPPSRCIAR